MRFGLSPLVVIGYHVEFASLDIAVHSAHLQEGGIAVGYTLDEIINQVTGKTYACFEPALDYVVIKFPKWAFDKFVYAKRTLGTQMKATGEVMAIGTSFEQAMMKAVRSTELGVDSMNMKKYEELQYRP